MDKKILVLLRMFKAFEQLLNDNQIIDHDIAYQYFDFVDNFRNPRAISDVILDLLSVPEESEEYCRDYCDGLLCNYIDGNYSEVELVALINKEVFNSRNLN